MVNYRKILQLDADKNVSVRDLLTSAHCSFRSYTSTIEAAKAKGIKWPLDDDVTNEELQELLFPGKYKPLSIYQIPDFVYIHKELAKPGVTLMLDNYLGLVVVCPVFIGNTCSRTLPRYNPPCE